MCLSLLFVGICAFIAARHTVPVLGHWVPALDDADKEHDDGKHKEEVDEAAERVARDDAQSPEHEQYYCDGCKHVFGLLPLLILPCVAGARNTQVKTDALTPLLQKYRLCKRYFMSSL